MKRLIPALLLAAGLFPTPASTQMDAAISVVPVGVRSMAEVCRARASARPPAWHALLEIRARTNDEAREDLVALEHSLRSRLGAHPDDLELRYLLAAVMGTRTDVEGARTRIGIAKELLAHTRRILTVEPDHPGANYLLGRLHAAVMRMDGVTRFVATRVMGGSELSGASWEEARARLEIAAAGDPCVPDHHYELARLYAERGDEELAREQLRNLLALRPLGGAFERTLSEGRRMLEALETTH
jgi:Flp pilus assembly protein TadD